MLATFSRLFAIAIVPALISALTARLTLGSHRREKWWEKRLEAYMRALDDLHHLKRDIGLNYEANIEGRELPDPVKQDLQNKVRLAQDDLTHHADMGELLLSSKAFEILSSFSTSIQKVSCSAVSYSEFLEAAYDTVDKALVQFRTTAKRDLGMAPFKPSEIIQRLPIPRLPPRHDVLHTITTTDQNER